MTEVVLKHEDDGSTWVQIQPPDPWKEPVAEPVPGNVSGSVNASMWNHQAFKHDDRVFATNEEGWWEEYVPRSQWKEARDAFEKQQHEIETLQTQLTETRKVSYDRNRKLGEKQDRAEQAEQNLKSAGVQLSALRNLVLRTVDPSLYVINSVDRFGKPHAYAINSDTIRDLARELRELQILFEQMQTERNKAYENLDRYQAAYDELKSEAIMSARIDLLGLLTEKIVRLNKGLRE